AQRAMLAAKGYDIANAQVVQHATPEDGEAGKRRLFIVISPNRGLCGGIHSSVSKATRRTLGVSKPNPEEKLPVADPDSPVMVVGDKSKAQLSRAVAKNITQTFNQIGKDVPTPADACAVADLITTSGFVSALSYEPTFVEVLNANALAASPGFKSYKMEEDLTKDLAEFQLANAVFAALVEGHAAEQSSRRNAMDNASKNAGGMINILQMQFNCGRQAAIPNELVDIITAPLRSRARCRATNVCGQNLIYFAVHCRLLLPDASPQDHRPVLPARSCRSPGVTS
ncbi:F1 complex, gamma subunit of ATPase, partial [Auricularia subglabra TFB-10046 SS5]